MIRSIRVAILLLLLPVASGLAHGETELYGEHGVTPQAVRQGSQGSCYFYASIAALAGSQPDSLRRLIRISGDGNQSVYFADGKSEQIHDEDVQFARDSGFDLSEGTWVAVLFRGYAQRTLRESLIHSLHASSLPPQIKSLTAGIISNSDLVLLAYDRAIRSQVDQTGNISRDGLKDQLRKELASVPLLSMWKESAIDWMDSSGFFDSLVEQVKANGELFGAYRAVGSGGLPERVLSTFAGDAHSYQVKQHDETAAAISRALQKHQAVVAWTGTSLADALKEKMQAPAGDDSSDWYTPAHAYTVMSLDSAAGTVTLRNPWGDHPAPSGEFTLPWETFVSAYSGYSISAPEQNHGKE
jgi:hypothetical protein